ncbi:hypothetical protein Pcinc_029617 [Petrolisthes cinctipes]|uniref:Transposase Tc1-like domain-containing protein n=1 Tax=Petrolisthes cinctipes TaxID=88211 RepID=A0AAE1K782_PETCI|nr:hypothetical protein Pcinc_029617 [Petrolisthes cinctipes]
MNHHDQHISERSRIVALHDEGLSNRAIAGRLGVSLPTVRKWIRRWQETGNLNDLERRPRSRVTSREEDERIIQAAVAQPFINAAAITTDLGLEVSNTTVRRRLHAAGLHHRVPAMKEHLTDVHRNTRLAFAQEHVTKDIGFWERTVFSDEKTFSSSNHGRIHLWRRDSTRYDRSNIYEEARSGRVTLNVWGYMTLYGSDPDAAVDGLWWQTAGQVI